MRPKSSITVPLVLASVVLGSCRTYDVPSCAAAPLQQPPRAPGYADTVWPTEHRDQWRTHAAAAGLPAGITGRQLKVTTAEMPPTPTWGYAGTDGKIYVIGGAPFLLNLFTDMILGAPASEIPRMIAESRISSDKVTPYLARIDPATMHTDLIELTGGTSINYTGGVLVHANGYLYAVARGVLFKIDPASFRIVLSKQLPMATNASGRPNEFTAYNGMQATRNGDLILKGFPSISAGDTAGVLLRVSPDDLSTHAELRSAEIAAARITIATVDGREYLYLTGGTSLLRFRVDESAFVPDTSYTQPYRQPGDGSSAGSSAVFMGEGAFFADNTEPQATTAMHLFGETATGSALSKVPAFTSSGTSWSFFMVAGDPFSSGIIVVEDQLRGRLSGFRTCAGGRTVEKIWENDSVKASAGVAIAYDRGHLYADDRQCTAGGECRLSFVVLDLRTGKELARTAVKGSRPSIGQIFIGPDEAVYYPATDVGTGHGYVNRISAN
jgi:hypothetical protein